MVRPFLVAVVTGFVAVVALAFTFAAVATIVVSSPTPREIGVLGVELVSIGVDQGDTVVGFGPRLWVVGLVLGCVNAVIAHWRSGGADGVTG